MHNNGLIKFFAFCFTLVSIYQISFTFITSGIEDNASEYSINSISSQQENFADLREEKYNNYLDSISDESVLGFTTYKSAKNKELNKGLTSKDPLSFEDTKKYPDRLKAAQEKTKLNDAVRTAVGKSLGKDIVIAAMDFAFIGGSMGSVVGEKIARAIDYSIKNKMPFLMVSKSGGARMMEASLSLMQLVKTSSKLAQLAGAKIPYISLCTDPTTGGTTASYAMLGDINIAEPNALIAFAGPRVVRDTTGKDLPEGFQKSEFVLEHGFLDAIYERKDLKIQINLYIDLIQNLPIRKELAVL